MVAKFKHPELKKYLGKCCTVPTGVVPDLNISNLTGSEFLNPAGSEFLNPAGSGAGFWENLFWEQYA